jgi:hypothetical protein
MLAIAAAERNPRSIRARLKSTALAEEYPAGMVPCCLWSYGRRLHQPTSAELKSSGTYRMQGVVSAELPLAPSWTSSSRADADPALALHANMSVVRGELRPVG